MGITKAAMAANRNRRRWINCLPFDLFGPLATSFPPHAHSPQWYGSAASRSPSPKKLKASTVMMTQATGSISQGYSATTLMF
jgi:hypothetical protein